MRGLIRHTNFDFLKCHILRMKCKVLCSIKISSEADSHKFLDYDRPQIDTEKRIIDGI